MELTRLMRDALLDASADGIIEGSPNTLDGLYRRFLCKQVERQDVGLYTAVLTELGKQELQRMRADALAAETPPTGAPAV